MLLKCCTQQIWKTQQWPQFWKCQFSFQSQRRAMPKNVQTTAQLHSFHMLARSCSKFFMLDFNSTWTENFHMYKLDLEKARFRGTRDQIFFDCVDHKKLENSEREEYQTTLPVSWETCNNMEQTGSKLGKKYIKAVYCHSTYLTFMQSTSCKLSGWMKLKLEAENKEELKSLLIKSERGKWESLLKTQYSKN